MSKIDTWQTCYACKKVQSPDLKPRVIVLEISGDWHFANIDELNNCLELTEEHYFCKNCLGGENE